jgi:homoserine O-succinyltransferase
LVLVASRGAVEVESPVGNGPARSALFERPLRIGIINVMPRAETYEPFLLRPLSRSLIPVEPIWVRLRSHAYGSSAGDHIRGRYVSFEEAIHWEPLDGLILSGAPVEDLAFEEVHYWLELSEILKYCRTNVSSALGLCWGGMAMAKQLGIDKRTFDKKLFGVFENRSLAPRHVLMEGSDDVFRCAHSRHSGIEDEVLEAARDAGLVHLLAYGRETGYTIFESSDHRYLMHLGHPEYEATRLALEWERDSALGRRDVEPPANFDVRRPDNVWRSHCNALFSAWLLFIRAARSSGSRAAVAE